MRTKDIYGNEVELRRVKRNLVIAINGTVHAIVRADNAYGLVSAAAVDTIDALMNDDLAKMDAKNTGYKIGEPVRE